MGSQTMLDLIASTMIFGSILLIAIRLNVNNSDTMQGYRGDVLVQQNLVEVVTLLEYDFRKIGYCQDPLIPKAQPSLITVAESSKITFWTDIATLAKPYGDGVLDSISYFVGDVSEASNTPNPDDRLLYRKVNGESPKGVNVGITQLKFTYYDVKRKIVPTPVSKGKLATIFRMQIDVKCENLAASSRSQYAGVLDSTVYQSAYWKQVRLVSRNLNLR